MTDLELVESQLYSYIPKSSPYVKSLISSMEYSLKAGGKRIRPLLTLMFSRLCGGSDQAALPFACAVEMIHTYSLIHDDLPCMDNDNMRRGKPSNHIVYGEDAALLAGDALQSLAFEVMTGESAVKNAGADAVCKCVNILSSCCGALGMVGGQIIDLENEDKNADIKTITEMDRKKTGALITASCKMGCVCAGADGVRLSAAEKFADSIGIAFQITDDILDVTASSKQLGKPVGSDIANKKSTYVSLLGIDECRETVERLTREAVASLKVFSGNTEPLKSLALKLAKREK